MTSPLLLKMPVLMLVFMIIPFNLAYEVNSLNENLQSDSMNRQYASEVPNKEYIRHIHSMINAYNGNMDGKILIETNSLIDTKYHTSKRNGDLINSLLGLPKGLSDAGR